MKQLISTALSMLVLSGAGVAFAQDNPPPATTPPAATPPAATGGGTASTGGGVQTNVNTNVQFEGGQLPSTITDAPKDHDKVVGKFGVGFMGISAVPISGGAPVAAPVVGMRYWLNPQFGIEAGLGLGWYNGSSEVVRGNTTTTTDTPTTTAFVLQGAVPVALATGKHYTFHVAPQLAFGYAFATQKPAANAPANTPDTSLNGMIIQAGGRVGAEIQFGFIGVPELSLQGVVGLNFAYQRTSSTTGNDSNSTKNFGLSTNVGAAPWAIFTNTISAVYYF